MTTDAPTRKQQVRDLLKSLETGAPGPLQIINPNKYIQHNLAAADGLPGLKAFLGQMPPNAIKVDTRRVFADGDYVFTHNAYELFGPRVGFDVYRYEHDQIVEHWDNLQAAAGPNPSGHSMIDGPTEATDLDRTAANKALVRQFIEDILVNGQVEKLTHYIDGANYTQHNPQIGDGLSGLGAALAAMAAQGVTLKYDRVHQVLGEGNFVLVMSEGDFGGQPTSFYDLFRVAGGRIVEHWDTLEAIPPRAEWKNDNGKF
jgi:predicted SnoaL-like aldol condensation-catalyzing enzyme